MGITLVRSGLVSRAVRRSITGNSLLRRLNLSPTLVANKQDGSGEGGAIQKFFGGLIPWAKRFIGFLSAIIQGVTFTVSAIFGAVVNASQTLAQFDWNASDKEIAAMIQSNNTQMASIWGGAIGSGVGWIAGIGVGYGLTLACPVIGSASLAKLAASKTSLEAVEELSETLKSTVTSTARTFTSNALLSGYMKFRRALGYNPPDDAPSWSIAGKLEDKIDSIKNPLIKAFVEEFTDEFFDSFVEAGYVFAYELDAQLAANRAAKEQGIKRTIQLLPDKDAPEEAIVLMGSEDELRGRIPDVLIQHRLLYNRDVGQIVGQPAEDWYRAKPQRRKLVIGFNQRPAPPWVLRTGKRAKMTTASIPDPKPNLDWETIKKAAKAFNWGKFRGTANLDNGRQMAVYAASPEEAEEKIKDLLSLTTAKIVTFSVTEEKFRNASLKKETTRMYPAYASLMVRRSNVDGRGKTDINGNKWDEEHVRFELWTEKEPRTFKRVVW